MPTQHPPFSAENLSPAQTKAVTMLLALQSALTDLSHLPHFSRVMFSPDTVLCVSERARPEWEGHAGCGMSQGFVGLVPRSLLQSYLDQYDPEGAEILRSVENCPVVSLAEGATCVGEVELVAELA